jgi:hypothetical protein
MTVSINTQDKRDVRALQLMQGAGQWMKCRVRLESGREVKAYGIPSSSEFGTTRLANLRQCSCPDFQNRQPILCAHIRAVKMYVNWLKAKEQEREAARQEALRRQRVEREAAEAEALGLDDGVF